MKDLFANRREEASQQPLRTHVPISSAAVLFHAYLHLCASSFAHRILKVRKRMSVTRRVVIYRKLPRLQETERAKNGAMLAYLKAETSWA